MKLLSSNVRQAYVFLFQYLSVLTQNKDCLQTLSLPPRITQHGFKSKDLDGHNPAYCFFEKHGHCDSARIHFTSDNNFRWRSGTALRRANRLEDFLGPFPLHRPIGQFLLVKTRRFCIFSFSSADPVIRNLAQNSVRLRRNDNSVSHKPFRHIFFHDAYFSKGLQTNTL
jgi:hypothetical protein